MGAESEPMDQVSTDLQDSLVVIKAHQTHLDEAQIFLPQRTTMSLAQKMFTVNIATHPPLPYENHNITPSIHLILSNIDSILRL